MSRILEALALAEASILVDRALNEMCCTHCGAKGLYAAETAKNGKRSVRCRACKRAQVEEDAVEDSNE